MSNTPLIDQYLKIKENYRDAILLFRLGDFYEMFMDDALEVSRLLNLTLTSRAGNPMCGIPYHAVKNYIKRLLDAGCKIAICEQIEMGKNSREIARREVVRIITPATILDDDFLQSSDYNYIAAVSPKAAAWADISTGDYRLAEIDSESELESVLARINPCELLVPADEYFSNPAFRATIDSRGKLVTKLPDSTFSVRIGFNLLTEAAGVTKLTAFGIDEHNRSLCAMGALLSYCRDMLKAGKSSTVSSIVLLSESNTLSIDGNTRKNLEILTNLRDGGSDGSLFSVMNHSLTSGGARLMKDWLSNPLSNRTEINERLDFVTYFLSDREEFKRIRTILPLVRDMARLSTRIQMKRANPHDLVAAKQTILAFAELIGGNREKYAFLISDSLFSRMDSLLAFAKEIESAVNEQVLGIFEPGKTLLSGYNSELDNLRNLATHSDRVLSDFVTEVKEKTGIQNLRLAYSRAFGYSIEVSKGNLNKVPQSWIRRQTLVSGERFTTEELVKLEEELLQATELSERKEKELFYTLMDKASGLVPYFIEIGNTVSRLDVLQSFAFSASEKSYVRPVFTDDGSLAIIDGRHPVVETMIGLDAFVANDLDMSSPQRRFHLITGPNMAGKSTYIRANALIMLLAHCGSYVPATSARIPETDRLFCRVGASDNLARGESTFYVEMSETAYILRNATEKSFVIMDEIGRGTSTEDGMSIAYAVMKALVVKGIRTLFATHYLELTSLPHDGIVLSTPAVVEERNGVKFLRKMREGAANSSYGLHVAKMAGIPYQVLRDASKFQARHFSSGRYESGSQLDLFCEPEENSDNLMPDWSQLIQDILDFDVDRSTPMEALVKMQALKEKVTDEADKSTGTV